MTPSRRSSSSRSQVVAAGLRVHAGGRLVDEDQLRAADHGHRQGEPLLLAAREPPVRRPPARVRDRAAPRAWRRRAGGRAGRRCAAASRRPARRTRRRRSAASRRSGGAGRGAPRCGSSPSTRTRPPLRLPVALAGLQRGGLAGAVGAEHGGDRCRARRQAEAVDGEPCRRTASAGPRPPRPGRRGCGGSSSPQSRNPASRGPRADPTTGDPGPTGVRTDQVRAALVEASRQ